MCDCICVYVCARMFVCRLLSLSLCVFKRVRSIKEKAESVRVQEQLKLRWV